MNIGVSAFLTEHSGEPGAIAQTAENLGFESFWVAEHLVIPVAYTTYCPPDSSKPMNIGYEGELSTSLSHADEYHRNRIRGIHEHLLC